MKNLFRILLISLLIISCSKSDEPLEEENHILIDLPDSDINNNSVIGAWVAISECIGENCYDVPITYDYIIFNTNGTISEGRDSIGIVLILDYTIDDKELRITQYFNDKTSYTTLNRIIKISNSELIFEEYGDDDGLYDAEQINRYFFERQ